jgi:hypothetical protein
MMTEHEIGGKGVGAPCYFCRGVESFHDILGHFKSAHMVEINSIFAEDMDKLGTVSMDHLQQYLVNWAWFLGVNYPAWWQQKGVLMPQKINNVVVDPSSMVFCNFCFTMLENNADWAMHCSECIPMARMQVEPTLRQNRLRMWAM